MNEVFFTADLHLGHANCIKLCSRPFESLEEMDETLISNWNARVKRGDIVYIVGDLIHKAASPAAYLERLNGKKILIAGNHDLTWLKSIGMAERRKNGTAEFFGYGKYFENIVQYYEAELCGHTVTLCHYPMLQWRSSRKMGSKKLGFHIYGHVHNSANEANRELYKIPHALNAGADVNGFAPVTFEELVKNNEAFKLSVLNDTDSADFLAAFYHKYQTDRSGKPYIDHPRAVAAMLEGDEAKCAGLLHDLLEDTDIDISVLEKRFSPRIVKAVIALTRRAGEDYFDYISRVADDPLATAVKKADLTHNMDISRLKKPDGRDYERLEKYKKAFDMLS